MGRKLVEGKWDMGIGPERVVVVMNQSTMYRKEEGREGIGEM